MPDPRQAHDVPLDDLFDRAPCGYLETDLTGLIVVANQTFLGWTGYTHEELVGTRTFASLLTGGGRIYHETHYAPMLAMQGHARQIALDIVCADGHRLPTLINAVRDGDPAVTRIAIFDATDRREYERELLDAKQRAQASERRALHLVNTLQQTLLPPSLPAVPGIEVAVGFRPAGNGDELGGDFYDVFRTGPDTWIITLGDVQGKGVEAAVITALMRYSIRAAAAEHERPSEMLQLVNRSLKQHGSERICTCIVLSLQRNEKAWTVTFSSAGHPLPYLRHNGSVSEVGASGPLLGFYDDVELNDTNLRFDSGQCLLLYTDGVSEARNGKRWFGEDRIMGLLRSAGSSAAEITDELVGAVVTFQANNPRDDIAVVTIVNVQP